MIRPGDRFRLHNGTDYVCANDVPPSYDTIPSHFTYVLGLGTVDEAVEFRAMSGPYPDHVRLVDDSTGHAMTQLDGTLFLSSASFGDPHVRFVSSDDGRAWTLRSDRGDRYVGYRKRTTESLSTKTLYILPKNALQNEIRWSIELV